MCFDAWFGATLLEGMCETRRISYIFAADLSQLFGFRPDQVVAGWSEALQLMREGERWELILPSNLAYGERGYGMLWPYRLRSQVWGRSPRTPR